MRGKIKRYLFLLVSVACLLGIFIAGCAQAPTPTPTPSVTPPPAPAPVPTPMPTPVSAHLSEANMASKVDNDNKPIEPTNIFTPDNSEIFCSVKLSDAPDNTIITADWIYVSGEKGEVPLNYAIDSDSWTGGGTQYLKFSMTAPSDGWPYGYYKIALYIDGEEDISVAFEVKDITPEPAEESPKPPIPVQDITEEKPKPSGSINRTYSWEYHGSEWTWEINIPQSIYDYYKELPRPPTRNYSVYVTHPWDDKFEESLASEIQRIAEEKGFSDLEKVEFAISFVQSLPYTVDSVTSPYDEYPRYPVETLVDNGGDCEDTSILLASILDTMGYGVVLIGFPTHLGVGVLGGENIYGTYYENKDRRYFYVETTGEGWGVGDLPEEYKDIKAKLYDMTPIPILTFSWNGVRKWNSVELDATIENLGSATAEGVYIFAGFDAGDDKLWNTEKSTPFELPANGEVTVHLKLKAPFEKHTRLVIQLVYNDYAVETSYSKWFDT